MSSRSVREFAAGVVRIGHIAWALRGPSFLRRRRCRQKALYYDAPTVLAGGAVATLLGVRHTEIHVRDLVASAGTGAAFHALSYRVLARRWPIYRKPRTDSWLIPTVIAEECLWRSPSGSESILSFLLRIFGFATVHCPLGGLRAGGHMLLFGVLAEVVNSNAGVFGAISFHLSYNLAQVSTEAKTMPFS